MDCSTARELVPEKVAGQRDDPELDLHLADCPACRHDFSLLSEVRRALTGLHQTPAPDLWPAVAAALPPTVRRSAAWRWAAASALLVAAVVMAVLWIAPRDLPQPPLAVEDAGPADDSLALLDVSAGLIEEGLAALEPQAIDAMLDGLERTLAGAGG